MRLFTINVSRLYLIISKKEKSNPDKNPIRKYKNPIIGFRFLVLLTFSMVTQNAKNIFKNSHKKNEFICILKIHSLEGTF